MKKYFSNTEKSFYLEETVKTYQAQDISVPADLMIISDDEYEAFMVSPDRKAPQYNVESECMEWVDIEPPTREETIENAEALKAQLLSVAAQAIAPLQDAVDLSMATDDEMASLSAWKKYRVLLNRVDTSEPDEIEWPELPLTE
ncbi:MULTISPECIES: tail fiber assembly protein [Enterobacter]|nr:MULTISPECIES: tail fiber assembly protein [Enterobacter]EKS6495827.1 tail fiber assembly protein [Enterobacter hormaechei]KTI66991.1 phage tail protein [Enterobacter hormaechei subsp. steigerwaltii]MBW7765343.1 tail fiber assembly protein [Enterobacter hormaechei]MCF2441478.1 tail fiber assembly protein [Enterobacter sp. MV-oo4-C]MCW4736165.1 tail fiber assembly protein [Enterobacter hormaechei subsp. xiangfangensis]